MMKRLFLFLLGISLAAAEWHEPEAMYRLTVEHDVTGEYGYLDFRKICLPETVDNGLRVYSVRGEKIPVHQYDADHLLLPSSDKKETYYIYYGYSKHQPLQCWDPQQNPVPADYRLRQRDVSRRYPNAPEQVGTIDSLKQNSPFIRNRRELWSQTGTFAVARTDYLTRLHEALVRKKPPEQISAAEFRKQEKQLSDRNRSIRSVASETLESVFFNHFRNRHGSNASRIFFTQRPFDTDRNFITCFFGNLAIEEAGEYEFRLNTNSTRIFRLNGKTVLRRFGEFQNPNSYAIGSSDILTVPLSRGSHFLEFLYYKGPIANWAAVSWRKKGQGAFRLLTEDDFAPAIPLFPSYSADRNGKLYPVVLRDDSLALYTAKHHAYSLDRYQVLNGSSFPYHWMLDEKRFESDVNVFALRDPSTPVLKLVPENPDFLPMEIIRKPRTGTKAPLRPDLSLRLWAPHFLYDDEYASITLEINSGLPVDYKALLKVESPAMNPVFHTSEEYLSISAIPMEHEDRYAKNRILKKAFFLDGRGIQQDFSTDFRLILPGLVADAKSLRILPVSKLPEELQTSPEGLLDAEGRRLLPILHRASLHEIRAWELPRKLGSEWKAHKRILVIAEDLPGLRDQLSAHFSAHKMELEFLPWSKSALPSGSFVMETLPAARKLIGSTEADGAILIPPGPDRYGILGRREELNMLSLLLEQLSGAGKMRTIILSTPFPQRPRQFRNSGEPELHESLRKLKRERGISFLELNAVLRKSPEWSDDAYLSNGQELPQPPALISAAAALISAEFERK